MIKQIKYKLYFLAAYYFRIFAQIQLAKWKPRIIVITGSSGKTTLLHLIESQLGERAEYSHNANSSFGIPFHILGLKRKSFKLWEWPYLFLAAPFKAFKKIHKKKLYIVEADCDRPGEGKFLADLLRPEAVLLTGISGTHSVNFDSLVAQKKFGTVEKAIAFEFGYFLEHATSLIIVNGDDALVTGELSRTKAKIRKIFQNQLKSYKVFQAGTEFNIDGVIYRFNCLLPEEAFYSVAQTMEMIKYLGQEADLSFRNFSLPPGRQSVFSGIKGIIILDSSYNATFDGLSAMLKMFNLYPAAVKWVVLGDMLEQGRQEQKSHEQLAGLIAKMKWDKIILMGPRVCKYTYPKLLALVGAEGIVKFQLPKDALDYLLKNITGGEVVLFKGARFMEGIIEHLLMDKNDVNKLCRREAVWQKRRKEWGL